MTEQDDEWPRRIMQITVRMSNAVNGEELIDVVAAAAMLMLYGIHAMHDTREGRQAVDKLLESMKQEINVKGLH